ncbi:MAG TPA: glycosyltransferase family 2 protein, partial [Patescibacteria group bacterium]|nr:glycosyltransferase family 2 protein [Patescibacteria group bacterium]
PTIFSSAGDFTYEVILVDSGSADGTAELAESWLKRHAPAAAARVIRGSNRGFAAGNNAGLQLARGRYVLLLNPDTRLEPDTLRLMLEFMASRPDVGIAGCKLLKADGSLDLACRRRFPNPWNSFARLFLHDNRSYNYTDIEADQSMEVDSVVGAFLLIRRPVLEQIGLLDENFFMYGEDLDWCWRCKAAGHKVWYYPVAVCWHYKGRSSRQVPFPALKWFHDAMWIFYRKHYAARYFFLFNWLVFCGIYARLGVLALLNALKLRPAVSQ